MSTRTVKLNRKYEAHGKVFDAVSLRPPTLSDFFSIGEPVELHPGPDGSGRYVIEHNERISAYLDRLAVPGEPGLECIGQVELRDAMAIKEAITGFFLEARKPRDAPTS